MPGGRFHWPMKSGYFDGSNTCADAPVVTSAIASAAALIKLRSNMVVLPSCVILVTLCVAAGALKHNLQRRPLELGLQGAAFLRRVQHRIVVGERPRALDMQRAEYRAVLFQHIGDLLFER